jgi:hypothetical protein
MRSSTTSASGDYLGEMRSALPLDDDTIDLVLADTLRTGWEAFRA